MRAVIFQKYGNPREVMRLVEDKSIPNLKDDEVLVKIESSSINAADKHMIRANYLIIRLVLGLFKPSKNKEVMGVDLAGTIHSKGSQVANYDIGDAVVADIRKNFGGGFAEYAVVKAKDLVRKPEKITFNQATTVPISGQAAMMALILCQIKEGDHILINGASGGVGSFGVQIAKALGAHVTAFSSKSKAKAVKSWGADEVIDYNKNSILDLNANKFDAVFDTACFESPKKFSRVLKSDGIYVLVGGNYYDMLRVKTFGRFYAKESQRFITVTQDVPVTENIERVLTLLVENKVNPAIQKVVSLKDIPDAIGELEQRKVVGKIVVNNQA